MKEIKKKKKKMKYIVEISFCSIDFDNRKYEIKLNIFDFFHS